MVVQSTPNQEVRAIHLYRRHVVEEAGPWLASYGLPGPWVHSAHALSAPKHLAPVVELAQRLATAALPGTQEVGGDTQRAGSAGAGTCMSAAGT